MPTRLEIRARAARRGLLRLGRSTSLAGEVTYLADNVRHGMERLDPSGGQFIRIRDTNDSNNNGYIGQVRRIDTINGRLYVTPSFAAAVPSSIVYELWEDVLPDDWDRALDRALAGRTSQWTNRPVSLEDPVEDWTSATSATLTKTTEAFPDAFARYSLRVANSGANGYAASDAIDVQPGQKIIIFGWVSVAVGEAWARLYDIDNAAYLEMDQTDTFELEGKQYFEVSATIPDGCGQVYARLGGTGATADAYWSNVGVMRHGMTVGLLPSIVESQAAVGNVWSSEKRGTPPNPDTYDQETPHNKETIGPLTRIRFPQGLNAPTFFEHREFFTALASDYYTPAQRVTGDAASTTCNIKYAEAAAAVELLESSEYQGGHFEEMYTQARRDLAVYERDFGPQPRMTGGPARRPIGARLPRL